MEIRKRFTFEAAHVLPYHRGKCARPHGHSYRLDVAISGALQESGPAAGMVLDFDDVKSVVRREVVDLLDHTSLNDTIDNPTCERIALWIWKRLHTALPQIQEIVLWETRTSCAVVRRGDVDA